MEFFMENWKAMVGLLIIIVVIVLSVAEFVKKPREEQINDLKNWLLYACVEAEKIFKSNMGVIKLRWVYDLFLTKFPALAKIITFELFSAWVDEALEKMRKLIESNKSLKEYIEE